MSYVQYTSFVNSVASAIASYYEVNHSVSVPTETLVSHVLNNEDIAMPAMPSTPTRLTPSVASKTSTIKRPRTAPKTKGVDSGITCSYVMVHGTNKGQPCGKSVAPENAEKGWTFCNSCMTKSGPRKALGLEPLQRKEKATPEGPVSVAPTVSSNASAGTKVVGLKGLSALKTYKPNVEQKTSASNATNFNLELAFDNDKYNVVGTDIIVIKKDNGDVEAVDYLDENGERMGYIPTDKLDQIKSKNILISQEDVTEEAIVETQRSEEVKPAVIPSAPAQIEKPKFSAPKPGFAGLSRMKPLVASAPSSN